MCCVASVDFVYIYRYRPKISPLTATRPLSREDLVAKFQADIPKFSPADAEAEVDKFLMDGEMLDLWIKYTQRKREDPSWEPQYAEEPNAVMKVVNFVSQYAIWIVAGIIVKDVVTNFMEKGGN